MRFVDFKRAIDKVMEYGVEEEKATAIVSDIANIFNIQPEDTLEDFFETVFNDLQKILDNCS